MHTLLTTIFLLGLAFLGALAAALTPDCPPQRRLAWTLTTIALTLLILHYALNGHT